MTRKRKSKFLTSSKAILFTISEKLIECRSELAMLRLKNKDLELDNQKLQEQKEEIIENLQNVTDELMKLRLSYVNSKRFLFFRTIWRKPTKT